MVKEDLVITVPSHFKCPISLDVMKSPVSLCTGVTYDRASIQTWLDNGNNTCPATMQPLKTKDFTPNHTLQRLIQIWESHPSNPSALSQQHALKLLHSLAHRTKPTSDAVDSLSKLAHFLQNPDPESGRKNRGFVVNAGAVPVLIGLLSGCRSLELALAVVRVLGLVITDSEGFEKSLKSDVFSIDGLDAIVMVLAQSGDVDSKADAARVLEALLVSAQPDISVSVAEREDLLSELIRLISSATAARPICAGISCLIAVSARRRTRSQIVRLGAVPALGRLLSRSGSAEMSEKALKLLENLSTCADGRAAICDDPAVVPAVVQRMLKVSRPATERAVLVLWSVCHLFRDQRAQEAVAKSNGLTKILLVMQSGCSPAVRQMCADLVKIFRVNSKSCLSSYDTKTTHIMPF